MYVCMPPRGSTAITRTDSGVRMGQGGGVGVGVGGGGGAGWVERRRGAGGGGGVGGLERDIMMLIFIIYIHFPPLLFFSFFLPF